MAVMVGVGIDLYWLLDRTNQLFYFDLKCCFGFRFCRGPKVWELRRHELAAAVEIILGHLAESHSNLTSDRFP